MNDLREDRVPKLTGGRVKRIRSMLGLNVDQLAEALGTESNTIRRFERNSEKLRAVFRYRFLQIEAWFLD